MALHRERERYKINIYEVYGTQTQIFLIFIFFDKTKQISTNIYLIYIYKIQNYTTI